MILAQQSQMIFVTLTKRIDGLPHSVHVKRNILHPSVACHRNFLEPTFLNKPCGKSGPALHLATVLTTFCLHLYLQKWKMTFHSKKGFCSIFYNNNTVFGQCVFEKACSDFY